MYFIDTLYGGFELNIPHDILISPELQRLREIRLCNINSPYITGGASLNRFEHAIGTAYLAQEIIKSHTNDSDEQMAFITAALLHDVVTTPFGHSLEYFYDSISDMEYEHANIWQMIFTGKTIPSSRNFYCGKKATLQYALDPKIRENVQEILEMKHRLAALIASDIDIDNIDNVLRFAFHIGISFDRMLPINLAKSLNYKDGILIVLSESIVYFEQWHIIRKELYRYLLENDGEFVAKALLERAFIECFKEDSISEYDWVLTDAEMVNHIVDKGNEVAKKCVQRLMLMDLPKFNRIFVIDDYKYVDGILRKDKLNIINYSFENGVLLHFIRDVNKTCRRLQINVKDRSELIHVGELRDRYLLGLFSDNQAAINNLIAYLRKELKLDLADIKDRGRYEAQTSFL